ncbi:hypothetical protein CYMTET_38184 [Cymbomonas tetramitiformis]|uniref:Uncharacterized protein n=1 Tax=Cymbomonas tetramitiformis TaxID=36881 RepID=A0AAE0CCJ9_9CHLO|nr:hypothetical protein CYMTET_38184 [Cymbomonas tetramitiformis]
MASSLWPVGERIFQAARDYDLDLACEHIPGVENGLSDGLSRYVRHNDFSDWQYRRDEFLSVQAELPRPFTLDGGADPVGTNAHLPRYCSVVDSFLERGLAGESVYANPDFDCVRKYPGHFLACQRGSPGNTSGTFVLPVWDTDDWWPLVKGGRVLRYYPPGSYLFTSPEWRNLDYSDGTYAFGKERAFRRPTNWVVVVLHFPALLDCRKRIAVTPGARGAGEQCFLAQYADHGYLAKAQDILGYIAFAIEIRPTCEAGLFDVYNDEELSPYVRGSLDFDKTADKRKPKRLYIPAVIPARNVAPVELLEEYVVSEGLPSGSLLFRAPKGASGWYDTPFTGHGRAVQQAYRRAFPDATDAQDFAGGTSRKSLGQWLWTYGWSHRVISDVGYRLYPTNDGGKTFMAVYGTWPQTQEVLAVLRKLPCPRTGGFSAVNLFKRRPKVPVSIDVDSACALERQMDRWRLL